MFGDSGNILLKTLPQGVVLYMGIYLNNDTKQAIEALNEVYFGQNDEITETFKAFQKFRKPYVSDKISKFMVPKINGDPNLFKFNRSVEKTFGFNPFALMVDLTPVPNAFTMSLALRTGGGPMAKKRNQDNLIVTSKGYRYKESAKYGTIIYISSQLLCDSKFTDREVFAILLHEIGHNFQHVINEPIANLEMITRACMFIDMLMEFTRNPVNGVKNVIIMGFMTNKDFWNLIISKGPNSLESNPLLAEFLGYMTLIMNTFGAVSSDVQHLLTMPAKLSAGFIKRIIQMLVEEIKYTFKYPLMYSMQITGYMGEKTADDFPVMYGFGPDSASALAKLNTVKAATPSGLIKSVPIIGHVYNLVALPMELISQLSDEHPRIHERILEELDYLERELAVCEDPKVKPLIQKDIDMLKKSVKNITNNVSVINPDFIKTFITNVGFTFKIHGIRDIFTMKFVNTHNTIRKTTNKLKESADIGLV